MKILAISGSPRRDGNTELLIKEVLKGAGMPDEKVYIIPRMDISGCMGCLKCRREGETGCKLKDDMRELYALMKEADVIVMGSPIYYGEVSGQMKCFMDRWYALRDSNRNLRIPTGKKAVFIITQGADGEDRYEKVESRLAKILSTYGMEPTVMVAPELEAKAAVSDRPELLAKAREIGEKLR